MPTKPFASDDLFPVGMRRDVPLAELTTLELGGPSRYFVEVGKVTDAIEAVSWARREGAPVAVIGGGSNVVAADKGWEGLVLRAALRGIEVEPGEDAVRVMAAAGEPWDEVVEMMVEEGLAGLECLSGIPGWAGATPIQNVGAYGQEVAEVIESVRVLDLDSLRVTRLEGADCGFSYRSSRFREAPGRFLVLAVVFRLRPGGRPTLRYRELEEALQGGRGNPTPRETRQAVLDLRRAKSMVVDQDDANRRSVGSFFLNPLLDPVAVAALRERAQELGVLGPTDEVPGFPAEDGRLKVPAAWLVEGAGFVRGLRRGSVGVSSRHALALIHHGGGTTSDLVALAREIRDAVIERFSIELLPEPVFLGFSSSDPLAEG